MTEFGEPNDWRDALGLTALRPAVIPPAPKNTLMWGTRTETEWSDRLTWLTTRHEHPDHFLQHHLVGNRHLVLVDKATNWAAVSFNLDDGSCQVRGGTVIEGRADRLMVTHPRIRFGFALIPVGSVIRKGDGKPSIDMYQALLTRAV